MGLSQTLGLRPGSALLGVWMSPVHMSPGCCLDQWHEIFREWVEGPERKRDLSSGCQPAGLSCQLHQGQEELETQTEQNPGEKDPRVTGKESISGLPCPGLATPTISFSNHRK